MCFHVDTEVVHFASWPSPLVYHRPLFPTSRILNLLFQAVVIFLEVTFNQIPFRFFHFVISMSVALMYVLGSWIGYKMNPARNGAYPGIVDWSDNQGISSKSENMIHSLWLIFHGKTELKIWSLKQRDFSWARSKPWFYFQLVEPWFSILFYGVL